MFTLQLGEASFAIELDPQDEGIAPTVRDSHTWEPWQLEIYRLLLEPHWNCVDCGANVGINTIAMAHHAAAGTVDAFEPVSRTHDLLQRNLARNAIGNVVGHRLGVGSRRATADIWTSRRELGNASLYPATSGYAEDGVGDGRCEVERIHVVALDDWWADRGRPRVDFLKIDIEGSERECLIGAAQMLAANPALIAICECGLHCQLRSDDVARDVVGPFDLFQTLRSRFAEVYLVSREGSIHRLESYAELRICMLNGHPVEDLLCCPELPDALAHKLAASWTIPARLTSECRLLAGASLLYVNRHDDGWAMPSAGLGGTRGGAIVTLTEAATIEVEIGEIYRKHAGGEGFDVTVAVGDRLRRVRVDDQRGVLRFDAAAGIHHVFVETLYSLQADSYLGNPADSRTIGARFVILVLPAVDRDAGPTSLTAGPDSDAR